MNEEKDKDFIILYTEEDKNLWKKVKDLWEKGKDSLTSIGYYLPDNSKEPQKCHAIVFKDDFVFIEIPPRENALGTLEKEYHIAAVGKDFFQSAGDAEKEVQNRINKSFELRLTALEQMLEVKK